MTFGFTIDIRDSATPALNQLIDGLKNRRPLNILIGQRAQAIIRDHLIGLSNTKHTTANRLGAQPSGFLGKAAEKVAAPAALKPGADGVAIALQHPGFARAFGPVTIKAGTKTPGAKFLTIPARAETYNKRYRQALREFGVTSKRTGKKVLPRAKGDPPWYIFVPQVTQPQDRGLLPTDEAIRTAALAGAKDYVNLLISKRK